MEKILFLSNKNFVNAKEEGGVSICTNDFIELLKTEYEVIIFPVEVSKSISYKIKVRLHTNVYDDYEPGKYIKSLSAIIERNQIKLVFLNLSNTIKFSSEIKKKYGDKVKIILCSHGNDTGDFLHDIVRSGRFSKTYKTLTAPRVLGKLLITESYYRINFIDLVLTVSPIEQQIENWIGAKNTFMVPRTVHANFINYKAPLNTIGFVGDLSHFPNRFGIEKLCDALSNRQHNIQFRLVGRGQQHGEKLAQKYSFVKFLGSLSNEELNKEILNWSLFVNLIFYHSRGVSTKLAKVLGWGLPVISTEAGMRGYEWERGEMLLAKNEFDMADKIIKFTTDANELYKLRDKSISIADSAPSYKKIMKNLKPVLDDL